jgi:antitoxin (DNA-binding transcriptional repressor) of toxin-antitoxin stability system
VEPTVINATELRINTRDIMERVKFKGECFLVKTFGQPTAMIISVDEYYDLTRIEQVRSKSTMPQRNSNGVNGEGQSE